MKNFNNRGIASIILILIIAGAVALGGGVLYWQKQKTKTPEVAKQQTSVAKDETANWKTYTNTKFGFQFLQPNFDDNCCVIGSALTGSPEFVASFAEKSTVNPGTDAPFNGFTVAVESNKQGLSLQGYIKDESSALSNNIFCGGLENKVPASIGGSNGFQLTCKNNIVEYIIPFPNSEKILIITQKEVTKGNFSAFNQILSTFKFIDQNQADPSANWKTYRNEQFGFEFKYPADWHSDEDSRLGGGIPEKGEVQFAFTRPDFSSDPETSLAFIFSIKPTSFQNNREFLLWIKSLQA